MELNLSNSSVNFAVKQLNGFVGAQLIFVKNVTLSKTKEIMLRRKN